MGSKPQTTTSNSTSNASTESEFNNWLSGLTQGTSSQSGVQNINTGGWAPAQANLQDVLSRSAALSNSGAWTPTQSAATQGGLAALGQYATQPTQTQIAGTTVSDGANFGFGTGLSQLHANASGANLDPRQNARFMDSLNFALDNAENRVNQHFSGVGRYGSGSHAGSLGRELGGIGTQAILQQYNTNLANQNAAANTLYGGGFQGVGAGQASDAARLAQAQAQLGAGQAQDQFDQQTRMAPISAVDWLRGSTLPIAQTGQTGQNTSSMTGQTTQNVTNNSGGTQSGTQVGTGSQTQQTVTPSNPWAIGLGALTAGAGLLSVDPSRYANIGTNLGNMFGGNSIGPWQTSVMRG